MPSHRPLREVIDATGERLGPSAWLEIDRDHLQQFASATFLTAADGIDLTVPEANQFGPELVDGFLSLALIMHFNWELFPFRDHGSWALNYGLNRVRFPTPVYVGERVRATMEIADVRERTAGLLVEMHTEVEVEEKSTPAVVADWLCMYLDESTEVGG